MKNKILVIFFLAIIVSILIYKYEFNSKFNILILGDKYLLNSNYKTYDKFLKNKYYNVNILLTEEDETYKNINNKIKKNYNIKVKNKVMSLNNEIAKANYIIISANNKQYIEKCKKTTKINNYYIKNTNNDIKRLVQTISKISNSKIIILDTSCSNNIYDYIHIKLDNKAYNRPTLSENYSIFMKLVNKIEEKN